MGVVADVPYPRAMERFPVVRQSTLAAFDSCALGSFFEQSYRRGWSEHHQGRGTLFHRVAGRCMREMIDHNESMVEVDVALAILEEVLAQGDADSSCPHCGSEGILPGLSKTMMRSCGACGGEFQTEFLNVPRRHVAELVMVVKKWARDNRWEPESIVDIEQRLTTTVRYSVRGVGVERSLTGQLDLLQLDLLDSTHAIVTDYKDTWALPAVSSVSEEGFFQQRFYAWLVMRCYRSVQRVTLRESYVRRTQVREATLDRSDMDQLTAEFSALVQKFDRAYEQQVFPPSPGKHCSWCLRPGKCPIPAFVRGDGRIKTEAEAKQMAAQLIVAESLARKAKQSLKVWVDKNGPVEVKDAKGHRVYGFVERERVERPSEIDIAKALAAKEDGVLTQADVEGLFRTAQQTTFVQNAPQPEEPDTATVDALSRAVREAAAARGVS